MPLQGGTDDGEMGMTEEQSGVCTVERGGTGHVRAATGVRDG